MKSNFSHVFQPIRIRGIDFKNRITLAPPSPNLASEDGLVTHEMVNWFRMFARGGVSTIYAGNCSIDLTESRDEAIQLNMNQDRGILPMTWFVDMGKQYGCHASFELNHSGENTRFENIGHAPYSASSYITENEERAALRNHRDPIPSIEMTKEKIKETVEKFGMAAERMKRAGMDIVMVHGGHGNLISQFTSPLHNRRTDEYGGDTKARARFAIEVCDSIRRHCGEDFVIEYRISADEIAPEDMHFDETLELIGYLKDHIDILHVSAGLRTDFNMKYLSYWFQNYMMDHCFNVHYARDIKKRYPDLLVNTVGSIMSLDYAEEIIANGWADFVAMCRPLMADPDMPIKYAENRSEDRRPCLRCNTCTKHLFVPKPIWCAVNPISGMANELPDGVVPKAPVKKRVAIAGGGPGGIQAMQTLLDRGHDVTLYEKEAVLGGQLSHTEFASFKWPLADFKNYLAAQCEKAGVRILLNTAATKELLEQGGYDDVIVAVGAVFHKLDIPGADRDNVHLAVDVYGKTEQLGKRVAVIGGAETGVETGMYLAETGHEVTVMCRQRALATDAAHAHYHDMLEAAWKELPGFHECCGVQKYLGITDEGVEYIDADGNRQVLPCDEVVMATGAESNRAEAAALYGAAPRTAYVGDCHQVGNVHFAVQTGFGAANQI